MRTRAVWCGIVASAFLLPPGLIELATQSPDTRRQFEVVSIRENRSHDQPASMTVPSPNRFLAVNMSVRDIIQSTYRLYPFQIVNAPPWASDARYDIAAKTESDRPAPEHLFEMLKTMLRDRFKLAAHIETRELPVFALTVHRDGELGQRIRPTADPPCSRSAPPVPGASTTSAVPCGYFMRHQGQFAARNVSTRDLATALTPITGRIVQDHTYLPGKYDIEIEFAPPTAPSLLDDPTLGPSLSTALREQLGMQLEDGKGPVEVLVIDNLNKATDN